MQPVLSLFFKMNEPTVLLSLFNGVSQLVFQIMLFDHVSIKTAKLKKFKKSNNISNCKIFTVLLNMFMPSGI